MLYLILYIYADAEYMFNGLLDFTGYSSEKLCTISDIERNNDFPVF